MIALSSALLLLTAGMPAEAGSAPADIERGGALEVTYLANEGFLLRRGDRAVLIDAFVRRPHGNYAALPGGVYRSMIAGEPPFASIDLALVSHVHADHFQAAPAVAFLKNHPETILASSPQVMEALLEQPGAAAAFGGRLVEIVPDADGRTSLEREGIRIDFLGLRHARKRNRTIQNLGHVIDLGGRTILHVGDADMDPAIFQAHGLPPAGLDVSLVPYWFFLLGEGRSIARDHLRGAVNVAVHVPPGNLDEVAAFLSERFPDVALPRASLDTRRIGGGEDPAARP